MKKPTVNSTQNEALASKATVAKTTTPAPVKTIKIKGPAPVPGTNGNTIVQAAQDSGLSAVRASDTEKIINSPDGAIIVTTGKDVYVNTYEQVVEQKFITLGTEGVTSIVAGINTTITSTGVDGTGEVTINSGGGGTLISNVEVIGTSVGAVDAGYTFPAGMTFTEFVEVIAQKTIAPTYTAPTVTIAGNPAPGSIEIGAILSIIFSRTFVQNDAGSLTASRLYKDSVQISAGFPYTDTGVQVVSTPIVYNAQVDYAQGPIKNNNMGMPDPTGRIEAGTIGSNSLSYVGLRKSFYGSPASTPVSSADVRAMSDSTFTTADNPDVDASGQNLVPAPTPSFTITIPVGATRVVFAYPATSRAVASVRYQELAFTEVKGNFTQTTVSVTGANSYSATSYRVYTYVPVEPFSVENHYQVFI